MSGTPDILKKIVDRKLEEIADRVNKVSLDEVKEKAIVASAPRGFVESIKNKIASGKAGVIAEIKKASPAPERLF